MSDDGDLDDWIAGLSDRRSAGPVDDDAAVLRDAVRFRPRRAEDLTAAEEATVERLIERATRDRSSPIRIKGTVWRFGSSQRSRTWALAAAVTGIAIVGGALFKHGSGQNNLTGSEVGLRGAIGGVHLSSPHPEDKALAIESELTQLGLTPHREPSSQLPIIIDVDVTANQLPGFGVWLKGLGGAARAPGTYRILIARGTP